MAVRTEKIQSLTGSAPLTLPTSLPTSNKGGQVSTTGVISTPATATSLSGLSAGGNSDWILFDHLEQDAWATSMKVSATGNGTYAAGDIMQISIDPTLKLYYVSITIVGLYT